MEQTLAEGYEIVAFTRAVEGSDAAISVLGPRGGSKGKPLTQGMQNILHAMKVQGVRRLVSVSTASARDPNDRSDRRLASMVGMVRFLMRPAYEEIVSLAETVRASDRDWIIVRVPLLNK